MKKLIVTSFLVMGLMLPMTITSTLQAEPFERHPEIVEAIHALERAKEHLRHAEHDFGGHREAAIQACDNAIFQLKLALGDHH
jgi:hypothetical protein